MRMEGIPMLMFWDQVIEVFSKEKPKKNGNEQEGNHLAKPNHENLSELIDFAPPTLPKPGEAKLLILEDNEAVIKITIKGRSPFVSECFRKDTGIAIRFVGTKNQMADSYLKDRSPGHNGQPWLNLSN